jgi:hypothetical protein
MGRSKARIWNADDVDGFVKQVQDWSDRMSAQDRKNRGREERDK